MLGLMKGLLHSGQSRFGVIQLIFSSKVLIEDSNGRFDMIILFCHSLGSRLGLLLRLMKVLLGFGFSGPLPEIVCLADLGMDQMVLFFFCDFSLVLGMLKGLNRSLCGDVGLVILSGLGSRRTHPVVRRARRWRGGRHFH